MCTGTAETGLHDLPLADLKKKHLAISSRYLKKIKAKREGAYHTIKYPQQLRERGGQEHRNPEEKKNLGFVIKLLSQISNKQVGV